MHCVVSSMHAGPREDCGGHMLFYRSEDSNVSSEFAVFKGRDQLGEGLQPS